MRKLFTLCAALVLLTTAVYFCPFTDRLAPENRYERASHCSVFIKAGSQAGTGVPVVRRTPAGNPVVFVWTAAHVVDGVNEVLVMQPIHSMSVKVGSVNFKGRVIIRDTLRDVALIQIDGVETKYFSSARFDSVHPPQRGTKVFHIGNFFGMEFDSSLSTGIISATGVEPHDSPWRVIDQTTTLILPGSSGGPIFREDNLRVVGLAVGIFGGSVNVYVPTRVLAGVAPWAVYGSRCPSMVNLSNLEHAAHVEPPMVLNLLGLLRPKE